MRAELLRVTATQKDQIFKTQLNLEKRRDGRSKKGKKKSITQIISKLKASVQAKMELYYHHI
jgi:hypothetical protein